MQTRRQWKTIGATTASSLALLAIAGLGTGAQAAGTLHSCGNHAYTIEIPSETEAPPNKFKEYAKNINESGTTCAAAYKFIGQLYQGHAGGFKCTSAKLKEPRGYVPQQCTRKGVKIQYGGQGG
jgi:hypothetical protein